MSFTYLIKFIPNLFFIIFDAVVIGIIFLNYLSVSSLLVIEKQQILYINHVSWIHFFVSVGFWWRF